MNRDQLLSRFSQLVTWQRAGQRAPHKPLLIVLALAEWARGRHSLRFADFQKPLSDLLRNYGRPRKTQRPQDPFWRLQQDKVWEVIPESSHVQLGADGGASKAELIRVDATGRFSEDIRSSFTADPTLVTALAQFVLQMHFPESLHQDILDAVGLELAKPCAGRGGRDPNFRNLVLTAYQHKCAICGLQLLLSGVPILIEAAHIKWHQASGPAIVQNGLALCVLHHKLFDLGAITFDQTYVIMASDQVSGLSGMHEHILAYHGRDLFRPVHEKIDSPHPQFIDWHWKEVFRGSPRPL